MESSVLRFDPAVFAVAKDYQIIFLTETKGLGWVEIDGERFSDEEGGLLRYGVVHKMMVPGEKLNEAGKYTVVFVEYADKKPYFPEGVEKVRKEYAFYPVTGDSFRMFQFADTHAQVDTPLELYRQVGDCDLVVLNGDINEHSYTIENFDTSFALLSGSAHGERPVIYSRGNHDTRGYAAQDLLDYVPTVTRNGRRETFYTFRQGSLWGVVLDCGEDKRDNHVEYGGTVLFEEFRRRETAFLESLIENREEEYDAPGVRYRIAICHIPFVHHFGAPFDIEDETYNRWTALLNEMGIDLLWSGHTHQAYHLPPKEGTYRDAKFVTFVSNIPSTKREDGTKYYTGGVLEFHGDSRTAHVVPDGESFAF